MSALARSQDLSNPPSSAEAPTPEVASAGASNAALAEALGAPANDPTPTLDAMGLGEGGQDRGVTIAHAASSLDGGIVTSRTPITPPDSSTTTIAGGGDLMVGTATDASHAAADDNSYTQRLLALQKEHPELSIDELMREVNCENVNNNGSMIAETACAATSEATTGKKAGVFVGNSDYVTMPSLPGAAADAAGMNATWSGQGYDVDLVTDVAGPSLGATFKDGAKGLGEGDELILYYAGHGITEGLLGVDYAPGTKNGVLPMAELSAAARGAESAGVKTRLIVDACESGSLVNQMVAEDQAAAPPTVATTPEPAAPTAPAPTAAPG